MTMNNAFNWKQRLTSFVLLSSILKLVSCFTNFHDSSNCIASKNKHPLQTRHFLTAQSSENIQQQNQNLSSYLESNNVNSDLSKLIESAANACSTISKNLSRLPIEKVAAKSSLDNTTIRTTTNIHGEEQKDMDVLANELFIDCVKYHASAMLSEENDDYFYGELDSSSSDDGYEIAFDPLDGSSNIEFSVPTG